MPAGRPTTYRPEYAEQARKLCRNGATDREIADILGVCVRTFYRWRAEHDAVAEALTAGKEFADDRVERALYERACGYEYSDVKIFHPSGAKEPVIVPITVHVPADVGAAKQWLATPAPGASQATGGYGLYRAVPEGTGARRQAHGRKASCRRNSFH